MAEWYNETFEKHLARVRGAAELAGLEVLRCLQPPYGWDLRDPKADEVIYSGSLTKIENVLARHYPPSNSAQQADR